MNVCFDSSAQRLMVKTTQKSDLSWSAIFRAIVYWSNRNIHSNLHGKIARRESISVISNFDTMANTANLLATQVIASTRVIN